MKANEILNKIKNIVGEKVELSEEKIEMAEIKLENGTVLVAEKFEAGESVFIKTEDEQVALPVGEYELEDKTILVVTEEGLIDSIKEAAKEAEEELSEESNEEETELEEHEDKEEMKYVTKEEFAKAVEEIKAMIEAMDHKKKKDEMSKEVIEEKEELSAVAAEPVKHTPEAVVDNKVNFHIGSNRAKTTKDRVFDKIFNNN